MFLEYIRDQKVLLISLIRDIPEFYYHINIKNYKIWKRITLVHYVVNQ